VQAKNRDIVNVKDFGAVGNGVADDTAAIQAALFPAREDAIFFVAVGDGSHEFCADLECHEAAVARYRARQQ
jgi:cell division protein YceG involved in septum cleavage